MNHQEGYFTGADKHKIYYQYWLSEPAPRAVILIAHGAAEHSGRYAAFAQHFTDLGYTVAALDHIGHGKSDGGRCCIGRFDDHVSTLNTFRNQLEKDFSGTPLFLLGHSMGGLISCNYLLDHQQRLAGCILSGPAIMTEPELPWIQNLFMRIISVFSPNLRLVQLDASGVSRDPAEVERYLSDPLNYSGKLSARMISEMLRAMAKIRSRAAEIEIPMLMLHGGGDVMTAPKGSEFMYNTVSSEDKQLKIYPDAYHEIFNEPERNEVFADVAAWLGR